jgi:hypothetical protein
LSLPPSATFPVRNGRQIDRTTLLLDAAESPHAATMMVERQRAISDPDGGWHMDLELSVVQRIGPHRLGDGLQLRRRQIADRQIEPPLDLPAGLFEQTDRAGLGNTFNRAAMLTPSPIGSPSLSSTATPRWVSTMEPRTPRIR